MTTMPYQFLPGVALTGPVPDEIVTVRHGADEYVLDIVALTSNYNCIYGRGCQGVTPFEGEGPDQHLPADRSVTGCCRTSPGYGFAVAEVEDGADSAASAASAATSVDSPLRVQPFVDQLRPDEAQHYDQIAGGGWLVEKQDDDGIWDSRHTTIGGSCIFLNTEMPNGKTGCALYHLADRLGLDAKHTRPFVCHSAPADVFTIGETNDEAGRRLLVTLRPPWFGWFAPDGYFCTKDPAAFTATEPVFLRMESEFTWLLGAEVYAALRVVLDQVWAERGERLRRSWGRPVALGMPQWAVEREQERHQSAAAKGGNGAAGDRRE
jgi:hypothetical protein